MATAAIDDDNFIPYDEKGMIAPLRVNVDQDRRDVDEANGCRNDDPGPQLKVHAIDPRHIATAQYRFAYAGLLLSRESHAAAGLTLLLALLLLTLLRLALLRLVLTLLALLLPILLLVTTLLALLLLARTLAGCCGIAL